MAMTVAGADPDRAAKKAQASTSARLIPPLTLPTRQSAKSTIRLEIPPFVIRLPANTKNAMAMIELDCSPPKILWAIAVEEAGRPPNTTAVREATLKEMDTGTPITRQRIKIKNKINPAFMSCFPLSFRILQSAVPV